MELLRKDQQKLHTGGSLHVAVIYFALSWFQEDCSSMIYAFIMFDFVRGTSYTGFPVLCTSLAGRQWYRLLIAVVQSKEIACRLHGCCGRQSWGNGCFTVWIWCSALVVAVSCAHLACKVIVTSYSSLIQFFNKMKKWLDMSNAPGEFRKKIELLERNFHVSTVIFKKYQPIFLEIFKNPREDTVKSQRSRKQR